MKIYLVYGNTGYSSVIVKAFRDKKKAEDFKILCDEYFKKEPQNWDSAEYAEWESNSPVDLDDLDSVSISEVEVE